jgi:hypothetical protein
MKPLLLAIVAVIVVVADARAQPAPEARGVIFAGLGYARTVDDEGLLGTGPALHLGAGLRVTGRLTVQAVFDRIPYHREVEYLEFDGRVLFAGVEAAFQSRRPRVRPFVTIGGGVMTDRKRWTHRTLIGPGQTRVDEVTEHAYTLAAVRSSGGLDIRLSEALSLRAGVTFHGLLGKADDLAAHGILQPTAALAWRW